MRTLPAHLGLTFLLPGWISVFIPKVGFQHPCVHQCTVHVDAMGLVTVQAPSREKLFDQAQRFLKPLMKGRPAISIAANIETPARGQLGRPGYVRGAVDGWQIVVNASIAFSPSSMPAQFVETGSDERSAWP